MYELIRIFCNEATPDLFCFFQCLFLKIEELNIKNKNLGKKRQLDKK